MTGAESDVNHNSTSASLPAGPVSVPLIVEVLVVLLLAVVPDIYSSFLSYLHTYSVSFVATHIWLVVRSLQVSAPVLLLIHLNGANWQKHRLSCRPMLFDIPIAAALVFTGYGFGEMLVESLARKGVNLDSDYFNPIQNEQLPHSALLLFLTVAVSGIANGFAEELVMRAWLVPKLEELMNSKLAAVILTSWFFAVCHLYQGVAAVAAIFGVGIIFGSYFVCFRRFWPLVLAHAAMDVIPYYYW